MKKNKVCTRCGSDNVETFGIWFFKEYWCLNCGLRWGGLFKALNPKPLKRWDKRWDEK
jgi:hypothetical protein